MRKYLKTLESAMTEEGSIQLAVETRLHDLCHETDSLPNGMRAALLYLAIRENAGIPAVYELSGSQGTFYHDYGKLSLPDRVNEPRPLSEGERQFIVDPHADIGERVIRRTTPNIHPIVGHTAKHHHSVLKGGYEDRSVSEKERGAFRRDHGISIEEAELRSVIASSACDIWDASTRDRAAGYPRENRKRNLSADEIVEYIHKSTNSTSPVANLHPIWMETARLLHGVDEETSAFFLEVGLYTPETLEPASRERRLQLVSPPYMQRADELIGITPHK